MMPGDVDALASPSFSQFPLPPGRASVSSPRAQPRPLALTSLPEAPTLRMDSDESLELRHSRFAQQQHLHAQLAPANSTQKQLKAFKWRRPGTLSGSKDDSASPRAFGEENVSATSPVPSGLSSSKSLTFDDSSLAIRRESSARPDTSSSVQHDATSPAFGSSNNERRSSTWLSGKLKRRPKTADRSNGKLAPPFMPASPAPFGVASISASASSASPLRTGASVKFGTSASSNVERSPSLSGSRTFPGPWAESPAHWPITLTSPVKLHPMTWESYVALYAAGALDLCNPPPVPPLAPASPRPVLQQPLSQQMLRTRSDSNGKSIGRLRSASNTSTTPPPFPAPSSPLPALPRSPPSQSRLLPPTGRLGGAPSMDAEEVRSVNSIDLLGRVRTDDTDSVDGEGKPGPGGIVKGGMRAPLPNFEQQRLLALALYGPSRFLDEQAPAAPAPPPFGSRRMDLSRPATSSSSVHSGSSLMHQSRLGTGGGLGCSLADEVRNVDDARATIETWRAACGRATEALMVRGKPGAQARIAWVGTDSISTIISTGMHDNLDAPRHKSFEAHVVLNRGAPLVVLDSAADQRFAQLPCMMSEARFAAGVPILSSDGYPVAVLSLCEPSPRTAQEWGSAEQRCLTTLAQELERALERVRDNDFRAIKARLDNGMEAIDRVLTRHSASASFVSLPRSSGLPGTSPGIRFSAEGSFAGGSSGSLRAREGRSIKRPTFASSLADEVDMASDNADEVEEPNVPHTPVLREAAAPISELDKILRIVCAALQLDAAYLANVATLDGNSTLLASHGLPDAVRDGGVALDSPSHAAATAAPLVFFDVCTEVTRQPSLPWWYRDDATGAKFHAGVMLPLPVPAVFDNEQCVMAALGRDSERLIHSSELEFIQTVAVLMAPLLPISNRNVSTPNIIDTASPARSDLFLSPKRSDAALPPLPPHSRLEAAPHIVDGQRSHSRPRAPAFDQSHESESAFESDYEELCTRPYPSRVSSGASHSTPSLQESTPGSSSARSPTSPSDEIEPDLLRHYSQAFHYTHPYAFTDQRDPPSMDELGKHHSTARYSPPWALPAPSGRGRNVARIAKRRSSLQHGLMPVHRPADSEDSETDYAAPTDFDETLRLSRRRSTLIGEKLEALRALNTHASSRTISRLGDAASSMTHGSEGTGTVGSPHLASAREEVILVTEGDHDITAAQDELRRLIDDLERLKLERMERAAAVASTFSS